MSIESKFDHKFLIKEVNEIYITYRLYCQEIIWFNGKNKQPLKNYEINYLYISTRYNNRKIVKKMIV